MNQKKILTLILSLLLTVTFLIPTVGLTADAAGPTLTTTLSDNMVVRNAKLTFDVWARNQAGKKITSTVTLDGNRVQPTWDDSDKTSYTLEFTGEGEKTVTVSASSDGGRKKQLTYHIIYKPAAAGEVIGSSVWSVELFTLGCGYLIEPISVPIYAGETAASCLVRLLHENGVVGYYSGSVDSAFYLAYIADGTASSETYNGYKKSGAASNPKKLGLNPSIPVYLQPHLKSSMDFFDPNDYQKNWVGFLGEFVCSSGSGWMYCVNNDFPNVGFSESYLSDGDVVRVQFTLGYGADIGGMSALGGQIPGVGNQPQSGYYSVANKDVLTKTMAKALSSGLMTRNNVKNAYSSALSAASTLNASQSTVDEAAKALKKALESPDNVSGCTDDAGSAGNSDFTEDSNNLNNTDITDSNANKENVGDFSGSESAESFGSGEISEKTDQQTYSDTTVPMDSSDKTTVTTFPKTQEETGLSENYADATHVSDKTTVLTDGKISVNAAETGKNDGNTEKTNPFVIIGGILAALAAVFAVLFGIRMHGKKTVPFQSTNDEEPKNHD